MLKLNYAFTCLVASALVLPLVTGRPGGEQSLARTLDETMRAIEVLAGFQADVSAVDDAVRFVKASTEAPILDGPARDERLMHLRDEVNLLGQKYGSLAAYASDDRKGSGKVALTGPITTGLSGADRTTLSSDDLAPAGAAQPQARATSVMPHASTDPEMFSADPVREARASYRAGRYADCLKLTAPLTTNPEAMYWSACALEKLERFDEAVARFRAVVTAKDAGEIAERAKLDLEFLEWKKSFQPKLHAQSKSAKGSP